MKLGPLFLLLLTFDFNELLLLFPALLRHHHKFLPVILPFLQILLALSMLLRALDELVLVFFLFGLIVDELIGEFFVSLAHLIDLFLIAHRQHHSLRRDRSHRSC